MLLNNSNDNNNNNNSNTYVCHYYTICNQLNSNTNGCSNA